MRSSGAPIRTTSPAPHRVLAAAAAILALLSAAGAEAFQGGAVPAVSVRFCGFRRPRPGRGQWHGQWHGHGHGHGRVPPIPLPSSFYDGGFDGEEYSDFAPPDAAAAAAKGRDSDGSPRSPPPPGSSTGQQQQQQQQEVQDGSDEDGVLLASLQARRNELLAAESTPSGASASSISAATADRWRGARPTRSSVALTLDDWIRRMAVDAYPLAAVGGASGSVYVADLESGVELCRASAVHRDGDRGALDPDVGRREDMGAAMTKLYGEFDGGGVVALAVRGDWIVSSGRDLGVRVFRLEASSSGGGDRESGRAGASLELVSYGKIDDVEGILVTALAFDADDVLWVGGFGLSSREGTVRAYEFDTAAGEAEAEPALTGLRKPARRIGFDCEVLSLTVNDQVGFGVVALANGGVALFSLGDGGDGGDEPGEEEERDERLPAMATWRPPFQRGATPRVYARTALIVQNDASSSSSSSAEDTSASGGNGGGDDVWSVVCGGSDGSLYERRLNVDAYGYVSDERPFLDDEGRVGGRQVLPSHEGAVMALASPSEGVFVSAAQDGTIRVWDCSTSSYRRIGDDDEDGDEGEGGQYYDDDDGGGGRRPRCLYALAGYKVWLGSICTDGKRLASDGSDNTIIVHDFSASGED